MNLSRFYGVNIKARKLFSKAVLSCDHLYISFIWSEEIMGYLGKAASIMIVPSMAYTDGFSIDYAIASNRLIITHSFYEINIYFNGYVDLNALAYAFFAISTYSRG